MGTIMGIQNNKQKTSRFILLRYLFIICNCLLFPGFILKELQMTLFSQLKVTFQIIHH